MIPEDAAKQFALTKFNKPVSETFRGVLDKETTTGDNPLQRIRGEKFKSGGLAVTTKTGMKVAKHYTVYNYGPPRPHNNAKYQDRMIVAGAGFN